MINADLVTGIDFSSIDFSRENTIKNNSSRKNIHSKIFLKNKIIFDNLYINNTCNQKKNKILENINHENQNKINLNFYDLNFKNSRFENMVNNKIKNQEIINNSIKNSFNFTNNSLVRKLHFIKNDNVVNDINAVIDDIEMNKNKATFHRITVRDNLSDDNKDFLILNQNKRYIEKAYKKNIRIEESNKKNDSSLIVKFNFDIL